jgi:hypothetical protein
MPKPPVFTRLLTSHTSKTYILTEVDNLMFDPIILVITIAILDNAFEANVKLVEERPVNSGSCPASYSMVFNSSLKHWRPRQLQKHQSPIYHAGSLAYMPNPHPRYLRASP